MMNKLLLVEYNIESLSNIKKILSKYFDEVITARNGNEALKLFNENKKFSLVITNLNMPLMNGLELIEKLNLIDKSLPIYLTTAQMNKNQEKKLKKLRIIGLIEKPINIINLVKIIKIELNQ